MLLPLQGKTTWCEQSHRFERLAVDGIHRARPYRAVAGGQQFLTYFVADDAGVFKSPAYLESANNSSPWTRRILPHLRNSHRTAFSVIRRTGWGVIGAQIWKADIGATRMPVRDSQLRPEADRISPLAIFIEGTNSGAIQAVSAGPLTRRTAGSGP